jgi:hypothetical protein
LFAAEASPAPTQTEAPTQPPASPLPASFSFGAKAFDPFAPTDSTPSPPSVGGFSSFDLLGGAPTTPEPIGFVQAATLASLNLANLNQFTYLAAP